MDLIVIASSSEDEEGDGKPYAVGQAVSKKAGSKVIGGGKGKNASEKKKEEVISVSEEATRSYKHMLQMSATHLRRIVSHETELYKPETIVATKNKIQQIGTPLLHTCIENVVGLERVEHECLKDSVFRTGVQAMARISSAMVGLFCAGMQVDIFGCEKVGITKYIHQVMSKSLSCGISKQKIHGTNRIGFLQHISNLRVLEVTKAWFTRKWM